MEVQQALQQCYFIIQLVLTSRLLAHLAGIKVLITGGIGGVHRGAAFILKSK